MVNTSWMLVHGWEISCWDFCNLGKMSTCCYQERVLLQKGGVWSQWFPLWKLENICLCPEEESWNFLINRAIRTLVIIVNFSFFWHWVSFFLFSSIINNQLSILLYKKRKTNKQKFPVCLFTNFEVFCSFYPVFYIQWILHIFSIRVVTYWTSSFWIASDEISFWVLWLSLI